MPDPTRTDAELLHAVFDAFATRGFEATSVREIARDLGVSHNTLPQRFGSKARLWRAAVDHVLGGMATELVRALEHMPTHGVARLRAIMREWVVINAGTPQALRLIMAESATPGPRLEHLARTYIQPTTALAGTLLRDLHAAGRLRTDDVALVGFMMVHAAAGPMVHESLFTLLGGKVDLQDPAAVGAWADHVVDVLLEGLAT